MESIIKPIGFGLRALNIEKTYLKHLIELHFSNLEKENCIFYINKENKLESFNQEDLKDFDLFLVENVKQVVQPTILFNDNSQKDYFTNNPLLIISFSTQDSNLVQQQINNCLV